MTTHGKEALADTGEWARGALGVDREPPFTDHRRPLGPRVPPMRLQWIGTQHRLRSPGTAPEPARIRRPLL